jgi:hypothetical protein
MLSAITFTGFFLVFSLSLDFWGRLILRKLKVADAAEPDEIFGCVTGAATAMLVCRWLSAVTHSFEKPFVAFVAVGAIGAALEIAKVIRADVGRRGGSTFSAIRSLLVSREWVAVSVLMAFSLSFWYCSLWPSGDLEPWLTISADYYCWIFNAGYWMGYPEDNLFGIYNQRWWVYDGFGTDIIFAMYSSIRGLPAYLATPGFGILLMAWSGSAVYVLVRRIACFPRSLAWLAGLGIVGGWLFKLLLFNGIFAQLTATAGYLLLLNVALTANGLERSGRLGIARFFFPLLFLCMSYQACYVLYATLAVAIGFLRLMFGNGAQITKTNDGLASEGSLRSGIVCLVIRNAWSALKPVLASTFLIAVVCPQAVGQVALRTFSAASQEAGYSVGFLDPGLFLGFPLIADTPFGLWNSQVGPGWWAAFLVSFGVLCLVALRRGSVGLPGMDFPGIRSLAVLFTLALVLYLVGYCIKGDDYRVWKFASVVALPISFLPATLLIVAVHSVFIGMHGRAWLSCAIIAAGIVAPQVAHSNTERDRASIRNPRSLLPLIDTVNAARDFDRGTELVIFDFANHDRTFAAMVMSQYTGSTQVRFVYPSYQGEGVRDYLDYVAKGVPVYTDISYPAMYRGIPEVTPGDFTVYRYDETTLRRKGAVSFSGLWPFTRIPARRGVHVRILVPEELRGQDLVVRISFPNDLAGLDPACAEPTAREISSPIRDAVTRKGREFLINAPGRWQHKGNIRLFLDFPELPLVPRKGVRPWDYDNPPLCRYLISNVELISPINPSL